MAKQPNTAQYEAVLTTTADAFLSELFPESLLTATDKALHAFESDVQTLQDQADEQIFEAIERGTTGNHGESNRARRDHSPTVRPGQRLNRH